MNQSGWQSSAVRELVRVISHVKLGQDLIGPTSQWERRGTLHQCNSCSVSLKKKHLPLHFSALERHKGAPDMILSECTSCPDELSPGFNICPSSLHKCASMCLWIMALCLRDNSLVCFSWLLFRLWIVLCSDCVHVCFYRLVQVHLSAFANICVSVCM